LYDVVRVVRERCVKSFLDVIIASMLMEKASWGYEIIANIHEKQRFYFLDGHRTCQTSNPEKYPSHIFPA